MKSNYEPRSLPSSVRKPIRRSSAGRRVFEFARTLAPILILAVTGTSPTINPVAGAQQPQQPKPVDERPGRASPPSVLVSSEEDYRIGPRDVIEVQVEDAPEISGTFNVSAAGTFLMPYLGRIVARQKTQEELAKLIADGLRGRYLKDPRVNVVVKQYNSKSFFIQGAVRSPGVYQIEAGASLLKLIILAGGLTESHGSSAFIIREVKASAQGQQRLDGEGSPAVEPQQAKTAVASGDPASTPTGTGDNGAQAIEKYEMIEANISGLLRGHFEQNVMVEPGDIINIPQTDVFFVAGEVVGPGSFPLKPGTTLRQAISLARGTNFKAATSRGIIFREDPKTAKREGINVDIGAVMKGKKEDIPIMAKDIIVVPNSRFKSVGGTFLNALGMNAVVRGLPVY